MKTPEPGFLVNRVRIWFQSARFGAKRAESLRRNTQEVDVLVNPEDPQKVLPERMNGPPFRPPERIERKRTEKNHRSNPFLVLEHPFISVHERVPNPAMGGRVIAVSFCVQG